MELAHELPEREVQELRRRERSVDGLVGLNLVSGSVLVPRRRVLMTCGRHHSVSPTLAVDPIAESSSGALRFRGSRRAREAQLFAEQAIQA